MARKATEEHLLELPVTFGGFSVGDKTCRIGCTVSRANYTVSKADKQLVSKRLTVKLLCRSNGSTSDQDSLPGMDNDRTIDAVGDCAGFSVTGKKITFGLTFVITEAITEALCHYPKRDGRVTVTNVEEIDDAEDDGDDD